MSIGELLSRTRISDVVVALGGPEPVNGRTRAWWRDGQSPTSVALDDERGLWRDWGARDGQRRGGGVLALIRTVRDCGYSESLDWLRAYHAARRIG